MADFSSEDCIVDCKLRAIAESVRNIVSSSVPVHKIAMFTVFIVAETMTIEKHI